MANPSYSLFKSNSSNTIQAFWVGLGNLSAFTLSIASAAILSRYFDKAEYGTYRQIIYVYTTLLVVFSAGLPRVFSYFLPRYSREEGKAIVWKVSRFLFLCGLAFSLFLFIFSGLIADLLKNEELKAGLRLFSPIPMLLLPTLGIEGIFSTYKKAFFIAVYNVSTRLLMLVFIVLPVIAFKGTYVHAISGWLVASLLTLIMAYKFKNIPFKGIKNVPTTLDNKKIFAYSFPLVTASIFNIIYKAADQLFISRFFGTRTFAEFANGFVELPFVAMITASTSVVLTPVFSRTFHENRGIAELIASWRNALKKSAIIIYPILIYMFTYASEIMVLLYSEKYRISASYLKIHIIINFFNIIIFGPLFFSMGKTRVFARIQMISVPVIYATDYIAILVFHSPVAVAVNSVGVTICKILLHVYLVSKYIHIRHKDFYPLQTLLVLLIHSLGSIAVVKVIQISLFPPLSILAMLTMTALLYGMLLLATAPLLQIRYMEIVKPIFKKG